MFSQFASLSPDCGMADESSSFYNDRSLTYLDEDDELPFANENLSGSAEVGWLGVLSILFILMGIMNIRVSNASQAFYEWNAIRLILPGIQWVLAIDCATLAVDRGTTADGESRGVARRWAIAIYMLNATVAPGIFLSTFVITFLAYRNRSIPFCMVQRAPGRNDTHLTGNSMAQNSDDLEGAGASGAGEGETSQPLIRPATMVSVMRLFSLFCFFVSLVVNFDVVWNDRDLAGRTGWASLLTDQWDPDGASLHIFLSLLPMALVGLACLYFSTLLWRYGSSFSMKIYPNVCNPYATCILGTVCLLGCQGFGPDLFPVMSRTGIWVYQFCFLRIMYEVRYDIKQASDLGHFLEALGDVTVAGSVADIVTASEKSWSKHRSQGPD
jgi:hypothetical protein